MSNNAAIRGPRRAGALAPTPSSGVRAAPALALGPATPAAGVAAANLNGAQYYGPVPTVPTVPTMKGDAPPPQRDERSQTLGVGRMRFDSGEMTHVAAPNPTLLAIARGAQGAGGAAAPPRRLTWFAFGLSVGVVSVWIATSDVRGDVFAARLWMANVLRSFHGQVAASDETTSVTTVTPPEQAPEATQAAQAAPGAGIPTVDVSQLPRTKPPAPPPTAPVLDSPPPPQASPPAPQPVASPNTLPDTALPSGAPTLSNAPGPR
jgi:hypothetical protein